MIFLHEACESGGGVIVGYALENVLEHFVGVEDSFTRGLCVFC